MKSILPWIAAIAIMRAPSSATTIVVIHTPRHIVVAADSLWLSSYNGRDYFTRVSCKVMHLGSIYFSVSTLNTDGMQVQSLASDAIRDSTSVVDAANTFSRNLGKIAQRTAANEAKSTIDRCWRKVCTEVVFFGIERGEPIMVRLRIEQIGKRLTSLKLISHRDVCKRNCGGRRRVIWVLGQHTELFRNRETPNLMNRDSDQELARRLVQVEKAALPQLVGGPIDVLTLDSKGGHWMPNDGGVCSRNVLSGNANPRSK